MTSGDICVYTVCMYATHWLYQMNDGRWVRMQGSGGQIGNGTLYIDLSDRDRRNQITLRLLAKARRQSDDENGVHEWADTGVVFHPFKYIVACRPIFPRQ